MRTIIFFMLIMGLIQTSNAQINLNKLKKALGGESVSTEEVAKGLKEALTNGVSKGSDLVSQVDGYFKNPEIKIPFPPKSSKWSQDSAKWDWAMRSIGLF
jgi:hypothetical protein